MSPDHIQYNKNIYLLAKKTSSDEIILELENKMVAVVHLTWTTKPEMDGYPITRMYKGKIDFYYNEMKQDILDFKD